MELRAKEKKTVSYGRKCNISMGKSVKVTWRFNRQSSKVPNVEGFKFTRKRPNVAKESTQYYKCSSNGCNVRLITHGVDVPGRATEGKIKRTEFWS